MRNKITVVLLSMLLAVVVMSFSTVSAETYYGFYSSKKGPDFKQFRHELFGFSIDIPSSWIFGVVNKNDLPVILIYPEGLNTGKFSDDYETLEIGQIPLNETSLADAKAYVIRGMELGHPNYELIQHSIGVENDTHHILAKWPSKMGFVVYELISLVEYKNQIRTIALRTTFDPKSKINFYMEIIKSFQPFDQKRIE